MPSKNSLLSVLPIRSHRKRVLYACRCVLPIMQKETPQEMQFSDQRHRPHQTDVQHWLSLQRPEDQMHTLLRLWAHDLSCLRQPEKVQHLMTSKEFLWRYVWPKNSQRQSDFIFADRAKVDFVPQFRVPTARCRAVLCSDWRWQLCVRRLCSLCASLCPPISPARNNWVLYHSAFTRAHSRSHCQFLRLPEHFGKQNAVGVLTPLEKLSALLAKIRYLV